MPQESLTELEQLTLDAEAELRELVQEAEEKKREALQHFVSAKEKELHQRIQDRATKDAQWIRDLYQYHQPENEQITPEDYFRNDKITSSSVPRINITREKCNVAISKMSDILFPIGDKNYRIQAQKDPDVVVSSGAEGAGSEMQPGDPQGQPAQNVISQAARAARKMESTIEDQLNQSNYGAEARRCIEDWAILGFACFTGPLPEGKVRTTWERIPNVEGKAQFVQKHTIDHDPVFRRVDPFMFWPDMDCKTPREAIDAFELMQLNKSQVRQLRHNPMVDNSALAELVQEKPKNAVMDVLAIRQSINWDNVFFSDRYQVFKYTGPVPDELLEMSGIAEDVDTKDPLKGFMVEMWFCQGHVLKFSLSHLEADPHIPYMWVNWEADESTPFGYGIPYLLRDSARVVNAAWEMLLNNSGLSAGPQVVVNRDVIEPADGNYDIKPFKTWYLSDLGQKPDEAIYFFDVPSSADELQGVINMAMAFAEQESNMPMHRQNEGATQAGSTATGSALAFQVSNAVQKRQAKKWDDNITTPLINRGVIWNMLFNEDESIKDVSGFKVVARGATDLLMKQLKSQDSLGFLQLAGTDEEGSLIVNKANLWRDYAEGLYIDIERSIRTDEEIEAERQRRAANQGPNLDELKIQIEQQKLQMEQQKNERLNQRDMMNLQLKAQQIENEWQQFTVQAQADVISAQQDREELFIKLAHEAGITEEQLIAKVGVSRQQEETKRLLAVTDFAQRAREERLRFANMNAKNDSV